jgi:hypothetical protein
MTPQQYKEEVIEKFEEKCKKGNRLSFLSKGAKDEIKDFLLKSIDGAYEKFREEEIERLEKSKSKAVHDYEYGWEDCIKHQINYLRTPKEK